MSKPNTHVLFYHTNKNLKNFDRSYPELLKLFLYNSPLGEYMFDYAVDNGYGDIGVAYIKVFSFHSSTE